MRRPSRWFADADLAPADVYCYLAARFGKPNGPLMFAAPPSSDNIIHWHYTLACAEDTLHIQGISARVEFMASTADPLQHDDWRELVRRLKADFSRFGSQMKAVRQRLERWTIFVNPYCRLEQIVADLHARLANLNLDLKNFPELPRKEEELRVFDKSVDRLGKKFAKAVELGTSLRMICPVWGESFVNLVIFLLAKKEIKRDNRLYQDLIRKQIDIRIAALHLHCDGFRAPIDRDAEPVRDFLAVMNARNDFLHGNLDPKRLAVDEVYFEGKMPLFMRYQTFTERSLAPRLKFVEPEVAIRDIYCIEAFIAHLLDQLEPSIKTSVKVLMETPLPGWRADTGRVGLLFSDTIADFVIPDHPRDEA